MRSSVLTTFSAGGVLCPRNAHRLGCLKSSSWTRKIEVMEERFPRKIFILARRALEPSREMLYSVVGKGRRTYVIGGNRYEK